MPKFEMVIVTEACIVREANGHLLWVGHALDPMAKAVERCNAGKASEIDLDCLSAFPVFDHDAPERSAIEILNV